MRKPRKAAAALKAAPRARKAASRTEPSGEALDRIFSALGDPWRRLMIERLGSAERLAISDLAQPMPMSLPAVLKHLSVLTEAGLVGREKIGRTVYCWLLAGPMLEAARWLEGYREKWAAGRGAPPPGTGPQAVSAVPDAAERQRKPRRTVKSTTGKQPPRQPASKAARDRAPARAASRKSAGRPAQKSRRR